MNKNIGIIDTSSVEVNRFNFKRDYRKEIKSDENAVFIPLENEKGQMVLYTDSPDSPPDTPNSLEMFKNAFGKLIR